MSVFTVPPRNLRLYNSISRKLEEFQPVDPVGRHVKWYSCGPTVYDAAHMGHARSYITFDILRRVLTDYFGYDVQYVMNITDIDDKIIKRARQEYLLEKYKKEVDASQLMSDVTSAKELYVKETLATTDPDKKTMREKVLSKIHDSLIEWENEIKANPKNIDELKTAVFTGAKDLLQEWIDAGFMNSVESNTNEIIDNQIFSNFASKWEQDFFSDMESLNVIQPDVCTRVSEYVPEIVDYIQQIIDNGYAYESNGSVYFEVQKFKNSPNHTYAKLMPEAVGDSNALAEGEGELVANRVGEKKSPADFALWKNSRPGEPSWDSPWGKGRPGWHIECSAMASAIFGPNLDIHTGGVDLKFPHHDNELAQSEAFFENDDWVKYFLHSGHLHISGCKMSKSLKNFITIKESLERYTASQLRLAFLLSSWKDTLDYSPAGMLAAVGTEKMIQEFFLNVKDCVRSSVPYPKWTKEDLKLQKLLNEAKRAVHEALCDNVDTRQVMQALKDIIGSVNIYMQQAKNNKLAMNGQLLKSIARYVTSILRVFGVIPSAESNSFGFKALNQTTDSTAGLDEEEIILPFLEVLSEFREKVRTTARSINDPTIKSSILKDCDLIRDEKLPLLGVRLEDHEGCPTVVKYVGKEVMKRERELLEKQEKEREAEKLRKKEELAKAQAIKDAQRRIPPWDFFRNGPDKDSYSQYDNLGMPTHNKDGEPLAKSQMKKNQKLYDAQKKKYNDYLASIASDSSITSQQANSEASIAEDANQAV